MITQKRKVESILISIIDKKIKFFKMLYVSIIVITDYFLKNYKNFINMCCERYESKRQK